MDEIVDADGHFFTVTFPGWVVEPTVAMGEMIRVRQEHGGSVLLGVEAEPSQVSNYGFFDVEATDDVRVKKVVGMVEKPAVEAAPSNLVAAGRYLLDRAIFGALRRITPGRGGGCSLPTPSLSSSPRATPSMSWFMRGSVMTSAILPALFPPASSSAAATRSMVQPCSLTWRSCWRSTGVRWVRGLCFHSRPFTARWLSRTSELPLGRGGNLLVRAGNQNLQRAWGLRKRCRHSQL